ncbi:unnamed protein product [Lactuca saligna]|uniref:MULE transposase domain-containing protein n=1 Tax=Lactuca saligna TaxID=75948 RepID=A0AA35VJ60_LACSI|nr:unnamed protein product [Lactuca saligna]
MRRLNKPTTCSSGVVHETAFHLGQIFKTSSEAKDYIKMHSIRTTRNIYFAKNDKKRIREKCRGVVPEMIGGPWTKSRIKCKDKTVSSQKLTCPWVVLIFRSDEESDWMVKTLVHEHRCVQSRFIKACTSKFLATTILQQVEGNPTIPVKALRVELQKIYEVGMSIMKVFRAKQLAQKHVYGDYEKQYSLLRDYVLELQQCNPGTTVKIDVYSKPNADLETRMFKRIYVCLVTLKLGFKAGLRDFLGFDGAFMKGPYPGQVLTVVGLDSNNGIYPLAYAIVESENKSSWSWFLECLGEDLELSTNSNFTFIYDRQKFNLLMILVHDICVGRPKKKRKRAQTEEPNNEGKSLTRKFLTVTCSKCKNKGHNSRSCKGQGGQNEVRNVVAGGRKLSKAKKQGDGKKEKPKMKEKTKLKDKSKMKEKV